jgi:2C-methyl-D-erythritol 2,4-cyclodiphosphate synthase
VKIDGKEQLDKIEEKIDRVESRISNIDITLVKQEVNLAEHMRRTELNEIAVEKIRETLVPINKHVNMLEGVFKFFGLVSILLGITVSIIKIVGLL